MNRTLSLCALGALLGAVPARAEESDALAFFSEEAKVQTASRRLQLVREAPAAVEIVTADEIRESGAVNLWDLMRFRAGMNVVDGRSGEGNRALVSIRGFPAEFVDDLLVLVDGRSVYTGLSGGAVWEELPVQFQDIERIEIVRGPSAALYGSNAGLGLINIITRKPDGRASVSGSALGGNLGFHREEAAAEGGTRGAAFRVSASHREQAGFPAAAGSASPDYLFSNKGNVRGWWAPSPKSTLEAFAGGVWQDVGVIETGNPDGRFRHNFEMLKHSYDFDEGSSLQSMLARRDDWRTYTRSSGGELAVREEQYDAEVSHRLDWWDGRAHAVYGASLRYDAVNSAELFEPHPFQKNAIQRGYASQSAQLLPWLDAVAAVSVEHSDTGGTQPAYNAALVASPAPEHVFRLSHGLAPTIPTLYDKATRQQANATTVLIGNPGMVPQSLRAYEAGYQGRFFSNRMGWETNLFYMTVNRLSDTVVVASPPPPPLVLSFDNFDSAIARGLEAKWSWRWNARRSVYANYTCETISDAKGVVNVARSTPEHKLNLGGTTDLGRGVSLSLSAGYQDAHTLQSQVTGAAVDVPAYWRVDGRLGWSPVRDVELWLACQNMTQARHVEFADGLTVARTYQAGVRARFRP